MMLGDPPGSRPHDGLQPIEESMCWNYMTPEQQFELAVTGHGLDYGGGPCRKPAEVAVRVGVFGPGPRFYCRDCAAEAS